VPQLAFGAPRAPPRHAVAVSPTYAGRRWRGHRRPAGVRQQRRHHQCPPGSTIYLRKLVIEGLGSSGSSSVAGVNVFSGDVHIDDCVIHGFTGSPGAGVVAQTTTNASRVFITNTKIYGNNVGVLNTSTVSSPIALIGTIIDKNANYGIRGTTASAVFSLHDSVVTGNPIGISAPAPSKVNSYGTNLITGVEAGTTLTPVTLQ
jgi:hypothetical protein